MNRLFLIALAITLTAGAATSVFSASEGHGAASLSVQQNSAAYRDGMYLGKLAAESGRKPHLAASRWTNASDRGAFLAGYESGYGKVGDAYTGVRQNASSADLMGFQDGISDGLQHRQTSKQFQVEKTVNFRRADRGYSAEVGNPDKYQEVYRAAYVNGYQQAFYGQDSQSFRGLSQQASF